MPAWMASAQTVRELAMGYVPPPNGILVLPKDVTITAVEDFKSNWQQQLVQMHAMWGTPRAVLRPYAPSSYAEYRRGLYGPPPMDWLPFLNAALLVAVIALGVAIAWALT